ncbi:nuclear transport factor 2 family protein [Paeniglutamicibacter sp. ABSL32-1]|uniref:nuclear transport factor 2 family protein n=1 Tax=Paeniglutamicibacter quisquiliarum TaxID=2849498 RepID=UPI001C2D0EA7|nr:nuclear transport factor 2 family protein [Paeniglutamicibacter quisquiliarum]MBV1777709.1 nuclear transport factor 2 family protein [Paeniglutamicibacter quisquiliarum]
MTDKNLFPSAATYFDLMEGTDKTRVVAVFTADAEVVDDGHTYTGHGEILGWLTGPAGAFTATSTWLSGSLEDDTAVAVIRLAGNFPGSPVDLRHEFTRSSTGLISSLKITA